MAMLGLTPLLQEKFVSQFQLDPAVALMPVRCLGSDRNLYFLEDLNGSYDCWFVTEQAHDPIASLSGVASLAAAIVNSVAPP
jgi:hypothetical protein